MTDTSKSVSLPRELAERILSCISYGEADELRAILAQPAEQQQEPVAVVTSHEIGYEFEQVASVELEISAVHPVSSLRCGDKLYRHPPPASPAVDEDAERAKFEKDIHFRGMDFSRAEIHTQFYWSPYMNGAWDGWLARAALAAPVQGDKP